MSVTFFHDNNRNDIFPATCRFAGDISSSSNMLSALQQVQELHSPDPFIRWDIEELYNPRGGVGTVSARIGTFVSSIFNFDHNMFGFSPNEAALMDPQQRILMEETYSSFDAAGHNIESLSGTAVGVYIGCIWLEYDKLLSANRVPAGAYMVTGNGLAFMSGRISYTFGLVGPCVPTNTACSSSLVAVNLASRGIQLHDCYMATASGVNALLVPSAASAAMTQVSALSPDGRCKAFGSEADGYGRGEGFATIVLEKIESSEVLKPVALLLGSAVNQDGRSSGLTAPHGPSQQALISEAMQEAGVQALGYVASHGTGTPLGDPIETGALRKAVAPLVSDSRHSVDHDNIFTIGAIKTLTGHLEGTAGIAGLLLCQLQLHHCFAHGLRYR